MVVSNAGSSTLNIDEGKFPFDILNANSGSLECSDSVVFPSSSPFSSLVIPNSPSENQEDGSYRYLEATYNWGLISYLDDEIDGI